MRGDHISVALDLPGVRLVRQEVGVAGEIRAVVVPTPAAAICPRCGRLSAKVHDVRTRAKADEPLGDRPVVIVVQRRRFCCAGCGRPFTEEDPVCGWRRRLTTRLRARLGREGQQRPVAHVAACYAVSPASVRRAHDEYAAAHAATTPRAPVRRLGLDEFALRRGQRYATGLHDLDRRALVEVVVGRDTASVQAALERLAEPEKIAVVSMDMARSFKAAVELVLPAAAIVVDKFHVVAHLTDALAQLWRRVASGYGRDDPRRADGRLALRNRADLSAAQWGRLWPVLRAHPLLRHAWLLKEDFRRWYHTATAAAARLELSAWRRHVLALDHLPELHPFARMLARWQEEILNYFTHRVSQGPVEGINNRTKVTLRQAYGYRNFANLRRRLLLAG